jgi:CcmD family protein
MENLGYLFAAYSIIFGAIALYLMFLWRRQTRLGNRLRGLEIQLKQLRDELSADRPKPLNAAARSGP